MKKSYKLFNFILLPCKFHNCHLSNVAGRMLFFTCSKLPRRRPHSKVWTYVEHVKCRCKNLTNFRCNQIKNGCLISSILCLFSYCSIKHRVRSSSAIPNKVIGCFSYLQTGFCLLNSDGSRIQLQNEMNT